MSRLSLRGIPMVTPSLSAGRPSQIYDPEYHYGFRYGKHHDRLPHVVKFSGGRSSGMLLFVLLKNKLLKRSRGDVVVFNNTGAEHPATYEFVARCKEITERRFSIPFFITEYQTYEDVHNGEWTRLPTYRLTNARPYDPDNPNGYRRNGEPFEEMLSWAGYVPNQFRRICTHSLKLQTSRLFLLDWFANQRCAPRLGHWGEDSRVDIDGLYRRHQRAGGAVPREIYLRKKEYVLKCPPSRPEQVYGDFTPVSTQRHRPDAVDPAAQEYISFIGLRGDEQARVQRTKSRSESDRKNGGEGREHVYMPLAKMRISKRDVLEFWEDQNWNLNLPGSGHLSNCVYCFLKGRAALGAVHSFMSNGSAKTNDITEPTKISWWVELEKNYGRDLEAEGRAIADSSKRNYIGFFGTNSKYNYSTVADSHSDDLPFDASMLPCNCTD